jgi:hypothetical protein
MFYSIKITKEHEDYLSYLNNESLIVFDEISPGLVRAKSYLGQIGLVESKNLQFYSGNKLMMAMMATISFVNEFKHLFLLFKSSFLCLLDEATYVKSIYAYEGLDERELSFPGDCYFRLLRKHSPLSKFTETEEWWEGVYEDRIGYFPSIFVQEFGKFDKNFNSEKSDDSLLSSSRQETFDNKSDLNQETCTIKTEGSEESGRDGAVTGSVTSDESHQSAVKAACFSPPSSELQKVPL